MPLVQLTALSSVMLLAACAAGVNGSGRASSPPPGLVPSLQVQTTGKTVQFTFQVTNTSNAPIPLEFSSGQSFDFVVLQGGREVWRWSADQMFTQALRSEMLAPGATRTFAATWNPPTDLRGELTATGVLTATNRRVEQRSLFRLP